MKRWLIYSAVAAALVMGGCGNKEGEKVQTQASTPQSEQRAAPVKAAPVAKPEAPKPATKEAASAPTPTTQEKERAAAAKEEAKAEANKITETVTETAKKVEESVKSAAATENKIDAATLFTKCAGCHGAKGEKHALGQSNIIAGQPKAELVKKIEGYQKGTYGGPMKGVMKGQVAGLSSAQIEALADYISKLK